jgi:hypothetical protein
MREKQSADAGRPGELDARGPSAVAPPDFSGGVIRRRKCRVVHEDIGAESEGGQPGVDPVGIMFRIGGKDDGPTGLLDLESDRPLRMVQGASRDERPADRNGPGTDPFERLSGRRGSEFHGEIRSGHKRFKTAADFGRSQRRVKPEIGAFLIESPEEGKAADMIEMKMG